MAGGAPRVVLLSPSDARSRSLSTWTGVALCGASMTLLVCAVAVVTLVLRQRGGGLTASYTSLPALACLTSAWASTLFEAARVRVRGAALPAWRSWGLGAVTVVLVLVALGAPSAGLVAWPAWVVAIAVGTFVAGLLVRASWEMRPSWRGPRGELLPILAGASACALFAASAWVATLRGLWRWDGPLATPWMVSAGLQALLALSVMAGGTLLWSRALRNETGRLYLGVPVGSAWSHLQLALSVGVTVVLFLLGSWGPGVQGGAGT